MARKLDRDRIKEGWRVLSRPPAKTLSRRVGRALLKPWWVVVDITDRCMLRCPTCAKWQIGPRTGELSTDEWKWVIASLQAWLRQYHLSFTGGEPLLRGDLPELISFAHSLGISTNVMTNGHLVDEAMARDLTTAGLSSVSFSLNGLTPTIHDRSRGEAGSHTKVTAALHRFLQIPSRPPVSLSVIVTGENLSELAALLSWAREMSIDGVGLQPLLAKDAFQAHCGKPAAYDRLQVTGSAFWPGDAAEIDRVFQELASLKRQAYPLLNAETHLAAMKDYFCNPAAAPTFSCPSGLDHLLLDPYGQARICNLLDPLGDIRQNPPASLWDSAQAKAQRRTIGRCTLPCRLLACNSETSSAEYMRAVFRRVRHLVT